MKRILVVLGCVAMGTLATPAHAGGPTAITVADNSFSPSSPPTARPGEVVVWDWAGGGAAHNVHQDDGIFHSGPTTPSAAASYERVFSAGTSEYACEAHGVSFNMRGVIRVRPSTTGAPAGLPFTVRWATATTNTGGFFDVQYSVNDGRWRNWKRDTAQTRGRFGVNDAPVRVRAGRTYTFRARSQVGASTAPSGWSPTVSRDA